jgi:signal transduction histidine kinase
LTKRSQVWLGAIAAAVAAHVLTALLLPPRSFALAACSDFVQCFLLFSGTVVFIPLAAQSKGRVRLFWLLIIFGAALWFVYQAAWTYFEVVLRTDLPDPWSWDVILFLHVVPTMAALALRPHIPRDERSHIGELDFVLLLLWWLYLYVVAVMPWQYVALDLSTYNRNVDNLYLVEELFLLAALFASMWTSHGGWRKLYAALFASYLCYSGGSSLANSAIARNTYYSGSLYDIPLVAAMAAITWTGLAARATQPEANEREASTSYAVWVARSSMIAVFSLPLFAAWAISETVVPQRIRVFRLALTLVSAFFMGILVLVRQRWADRELVRLLDLSNESFTHLKHLQAQILQTEKIASIGQLVGGVAHEINNPLTAMLGYSDLLLGTTLSPKQQALAARIGNHARRTKSLVASLINFASLGPSIPTSVDLNALARTAVKLTQPQWEPAHLEIATQLDPTLPRLVGDSNQLLQVCLQLIENAICAVTEWGGKTITVGTQQEPGTCIFQVVAYAPLAAKPAASQPSPISRLGLSACQGILQQHQGTISQEHRPDGTLRLSIQLPAAGSEPAESKNKEATLPILWESQPFA